MPLTVVVAPDSFKGSLSALEVATAVSAGWRRLRPEDSMLLIPQADGGEGTLDAVEASVPGAVRREARLVTGPDGTPTPGVWLELPGGVAVVELAQSSGLPLMREPDALGATTRGLGEVIRSALTAGARSLVIGLGGSASTDGAAGALAALGLGLSDDGGEPIPDGGGGLRRLARIDATRLMPRPVGGVTLLADVTAPLTGPNGAAAVFAPQKGASPAQVAELDAALTHWAQLLGGHPEAAGAGAAGGAAYGFATVWEARIVSGADYLAELSGLSATIAAADVLLTGEGRFDEQSLTGKVVGQLLRSASAAGVRAGVIAGQVTVDRAVWTASLSELAGSVEAALADPTAWLRLAGERAARELA